MMEDGKVMVMKDGKSMMPVDNTTVSMGTTSMADERVRWDYASVEEWRIHI